ncbi:hypothetical protein [Erwinia amylovora]|uniref:hypothetical protein n=1 Tax=Erwinia amylovora TaxID=552 RepID=UPI001F04D42C|nr:hypothetical protein [Erwinia amylovora]
MTEKDAIPLINKPIAATRKAFFIAGFALASWAPLIPLTKERLQVDNGMIGVILLAFGLGSLVMMPLSGMLAARFGCRRVFTLSPRFYAGAAVGVSYAAGIGDIG